MNTQSVTIRTIAPEFIAKQKIWLFWRYRKKAKVPCNKLGGMVSIYKATLMDFESARAIAAQNQLGLGFVLKAGDPVLVADFDKINPLSTKAREIISKCNSYTELSPSGNGFHVIFNSSENITIVKKGFEVYSDKRFITFTGQRISNEKSVLPNNFIIAKWRSQFNEKSGKTIEFSWLDNVTDVGSLNIPQQLAKTIAESSRSKGDDLSTVGYFVATEMANLGYSHNEILGLFMNSDYGIYDLHKNKSGGFKWIKKYVIAPAFNDISETKKEAQDNNFLPPSVAFRDLMENMSKSAIYPIESFTFASTLAAVSIILSNRYEYSGVRPNVYVCVHTKTAGGKQHVLDYAKHLIKESGFQDRIYSEMASDVVLEHLLTTESNLLLLMDEFVHFLRKVEQNTWARAFRSCLLKLYSSSKVAYYGSVALTRNKGERVIIESPCVSLLAAGITDEIMEITSESDVYDGFFNRFIFFEGEQNKPQRSWTELNNLNLSWLKKFQSTLFVGDEITYVQSAPGVDNMFYDCLCQQSKSVDKLLGRVTENAKKVAMILAIIENSKKPVVTKDIAQWSISLVKKQANKLSGLIAQNLYSNRSDKDRLDINNVKQCIDRLFDDYKLYTSHYKSELRKVKRGGVSAYRLFKATRLTKYRLDQILVSLQEAREISCEKDPTGGLIIKRIK